MSTSSERWVARPSAVIAERDRQERSAMRVYGPAFDTFLDEVITLGADAIAEGALVAAADPFVYTNVMHRWRAAIRYIAETRPDDAAVLAVLERSDVPLRLYEAARDVLLAARVNGWSTWWTKVQLGRALIPRQKDGTSRALYRSEIARMARTAGTWRTASLVLDAAPMHGFGRLRWVARIDARTRETHLEANGQTVPAGTPFVVGGHEMPGPGFPGAPAAEIANCRCVVVAVPD